MYARENLKRAISEFRSTVGRVAEEIAPHEFDAFTQLEIEIVYAMEKNLSLWRLFVVLPSPFQSYGRTTEISTSLCADQNALTLREVSRLDDLRQDKASRYDRREDAESEHLSFVPLLFEVRQLQVHQTCQGVACADLRT